MVTQNHPLELGVDITPKKQGSKSTENELQNIESALPPTRRALLQPTHQPNAFR